MNNLYFYDYKHIPYNKSIKENNQCITISAVEFVFTASISKKEGKQFIELYKLSEDTQENLSFEISETSTIISDFVYISLIHSLWFSLQDEMIFINNDLKITKRIKLTEPILATKWNPCYNLLCIYFASGLIRCCTIDNLNSDLITLHEYESKNIASVDKNIKDRKITIDWNDTDEMDMFVVNCLDGNNRSISIFNRNCEIQSSLKYNHAAFSSVVSFCPKENNLICIKMKHTTPILTFIDDKCATISVHPLEQGIEVLDIKWSPCKEYFALYQKNQNGYFIDVIDIFKKNIEIKQRIPIKKRNPLVSFCFFKLNIKLLALEICTRNGYYNYIYVKNILRLTWIEDYSIVCNVNGRKMAAHFHYNPPNGDSAQIVTGIQLKNAINAVIFCQSLKLLAVIDASDFVNIYDYSDPHNWKIISSFNLDKIDSDDPVCHYRFYFRKDHLVGVAIDECYDLKIAYDDDIIIKENCKKHVLYAQYLVNSNKDFLMFGDEHEIPVVDCISFDFPKTTYTVYLDVKFDLYINDVKMSEQIKMMCLHYDFLVLIVKRKKYDFISQFRLDEVAFFYAVKKQSLLKHSSFMVTDRGATILYTLARSDRVILFLPLGGSKNFVKIKGFDYEAYVQNNGVSPVMKKHLRYIVKKNLSINNTDQKVNLPSTVEIVKKKTPEPEPKPNLVSKETTTPKNPENEVKRKKRKKVNLPSTVEIVKKKTPEPEPKPNLVSKETTTPKNPENEVKRKKRKRCRKTARQRRLELELKNSQQLLNPIVPSALPLLPPCSPVSPSPLPDIEPYSPISLSPSPRLPPYSPLSPSPPPILSTSLPLPPSTPVSRWSPPPPMVLPSPPLPPVSPSPKKSLLPPSQHLPPLPPHSSPLPLSIPLPPYSPPFLPTPQHLLPLPPPTPPLPLALPPHLSPKLPALPFSPPPLPSVAPVRNTYNSFEMNQPTQGYYQRNPYEDYRDSMHNNVYNSLRNIQDYCRYYELNKQQPWYQDELYNDYYYQEYYNRECWYRERMYDEYYYQQNLTNAEQAWDPEIFYQQNFPNREPLATYNEPNVDPKLKKQSSNKPNFDPNDCELRLHQQSLDLKKWLAHRAKAEERELEKAKRKAEKLKMSKQNDAEKASKGNKTQSDQGNNELKVGKKSKKKKKKTRWQTDSLVKIKPTKPGELEDEKELNSDKTNQSTPQPKTYQPSLQPKINQPTLQPKINQPISQPKLNQPMPQNKINQPTPQFKINQPTLQPKINQPMSQPKINQPMPQNKINQSTPQFKINQPTLQPKINQPTTQAKTNKATPQPIDENKKENVPQLKKISRWGQGDTPQKNPSLQIKQPVPLQNQGLPKPLGKQPLTIQGQPKLVNKQTLNIQGQPKPVSIEPIKIGEQPKHLAIEGQPKSVYKEPSKIQSQTILRKQPVKIQGQPNTLSKAPSNLNQGLPNSAKSNLPAVNNADNDLKKKKTITRWQPSNDQKKCNGKSTEEENDPSQQQPDSFSPEENNFYRHAILRFLHKMKREKIQRNRLKRRATRFINVEPKPKKSRPDPNDESDIYTVIIRDNSNPDGTMAESYALLLNLKMLQIIDGILRRKEVPPKIEEAELIDNYFYVQCAGTYSLEWLTAFAKRQGYQWNGPKFTLILKQHDKRKTIKTLSILVPGEHLGTHIFLERLKEQNTNLDTSTWKVVNSRMTVKGVEYDLEMDEDSYDEIEELDRKIYYEMEELVFTDVKKIPEIPKVVPTLVKTYR